MNYIDKFGIVFSYIDSLLENPGILIAAIDGNCAAGKTSLSYLIEKKYECNVFHMDDYFLTLELKTEERLAEVGGNVDRERFHNEIIKGILSGQDFSYSKYDCRQQSFSLPVSVEQKKLNVIEGAYSMHPSLAGFYDLTIFLSLDDEDEQNRRIMLRNGSQMYRRFIEEWLPMEKRYFKEFRIKENADLLIIC